MSQIIEMPARATFAAGVAANIRAEAARANVRQVDLARALGLSQAGVSDRYRGVTPWGLNEIEVVARVLRTTTSELCAIRDSNPEPADSEPADVIDLAAWRASRVQGTAVAA